MMLTVIIVAGGLVLVALYDVVQRKHAILRNYPIVGHFRYLFEAVGPELRQYIVTDNDEERPFSRDQRRWVYASAKRENNLFGFGSDNAMEESPNYVIVKHSAFPLPEPHAGDLDYDPLHRIPCAKMWGGHRARAKAFRPESVVYVSGMSFGSLGARAVEALNRGCRQANALHNTGEGGLSPHHLHGADVIWQLGTGYFGARAPDGSFSRERVLDTVARHAEIKAIEIKLSQGAKPGHGGILPGHKVTPAIAAARGVPVGQTVHSPANHSAFAGVDEMLDFVEDLAEATGLPVGIKSAVGQMHFWEELARLMADTSRGVDFIQVDGGEGGTGAAPLAFTDHVAFPFKVGFARVFRALAERDVHQRVVLVGSGRLGLPEPALLAFALGCDMVALGREPMLALGCIQAQRCHTGHCPTGVTTHNRWLQRGLDPTLKADRVANYLVQLRSELMSLARACGVAHPALVRPEHVEILDDRFGGATVADVFGVGGGIARLPADDLAVLASAASRFPEGQGMPR